MDTFDQEILKFWAALQHNNVRYIMIGGYAANLHGYQRYTADLDIWIEDSPENRRRLKESFIECFQTASIADIDNVKVPFLNIGQLIQNKRAVNRPKDQIDVLELEKIRKIQDESL